MNNRFQKAFGKLQEAARTLCTAQEHSEILRAEKMALESLSGLSDTPMAIPAAKLAGRILVGARKARVMMGIKAARPKKSKPRRWAEGFLVGRAAREVRQTYPQALRLHLVGSRLRHPEARDLEFVVVVSREEDMPSRNIIDAFRVDGFDVDLFFATPDEVETHIIEYGTGMDIVRYKRAAIQHGFKFNRYGLWKNDRKVSGSMRDIARLIGMPLKPHLVWSLEHPF